jgi:phosphatidylserine/phosphatidylglycerophosphate/cardiolipin synthase-like enzyme
MNRFLPDERFLPAVIQLIQPATTTIMISTYKLEHTLRTRGDALRVLFEAIVAAKQKGITVKVLLNWNDLKRSVAKTNLFAMTWLARHGIESRYLKENRCCHAKLVIVDKTAVILGSHNLSCKSVSENLEASIVTDDKEIVEQATMLFSHAWEKAQTLKTLQTALTSKNE